MNRDFNLPPGVRQQDLETDLHEVPVDNERLADEEDRAYEREAERRAAEAEHRRDAKEDR